MTGAAATSGLTPVSFRKARGHAPRLSRPYVPGVRNERFWSDDELAIVRKHYAARGASYCATLLPLRTSYQVYAKANGLGLKRDGCVARGPRVSLTAALERRIRAAWPELKGKGAVLRLALELGLKRETLSKFALRLGLTLPHKKEPPWSPAELELMKRVPLHNVDRCSDIFREHGFVRSPASIMVKAKRLSLSRRYNEALSATAVAKILGVDAKGITALCIEGRLKAGRRVTQRLPQQGGDWWTVRREDLRQYIIDNIEHIDIRKVDRIAFVDVLVNNAPAPARKASVYRAIPKLRAIGYRVERRRRAA